MNKFVTASIIIYCLSTSLLLSQSLQLVWADEFNEATIDRSIWSFEFGTANDNVHYFTDRIENAKIVDSVLQIIALEESYEGFNYTSALLKTQNSMSWRYGRIEARIKLPGTNGFVPAFWMLPEDSKYGWWPSSGEIDILEHPTNQVDKIYGTVHTGAYNSFTGSGPEGGTIIIPDAETEFHIYAIEWTEDKIDFYVDDQKYYTFNNDLSGFETWPFDQPFYVILSMGVGGGWVGNPDASTVFPAIMEVDYVRVYQNVNDVLITGNDFLPRYTKSSNYHLPYIEGADYSWNITGDAVIVSGDNTNSVNVDWNTFSGDVKATITINDSSYNYKHPVIVANNLLKNYGFEKGTAFWFYTRPYPGDITFKLDSTDPHSGNNCVLVEVKSESVNAWDVQLYQHEILLESSKQYSVSFWAKAHTAGTKMTAAIINSTNFAPFDIKEFTLTDVWEKYELSFTPTSTVVGQFNLDLGGHLGRYYFDDFVLSLPELNDDSNQITNADFSNGNDGWIFNSFATALATGEVINGEYAVNISNGGTNLWDIHLGQSEINCELGKEYFVSFDAYAAEPRNISALVGKNSDPWTVYSGDQLFSLTTKKVRYSFSFVMNHATDNLARFGFDLGTSSADVYFDNIKLSKGETPTGIEIDNPVLSESFQLYQNYPNPFNPTTTIKYSVPGTLIPSGAEGLSVQLKIYDILGNILTTLLNQPHSPGNYTIEFDGTGLSSGVYYYQIKAGAFIQSKKMLLLK